MGISQRNLGIGTGRTDYGNSGISEYIAGCNGYAGAIGADGSGTLGTDQ